MSEGEPIQGGQKKLYLEDYPDLTTISRDDLGSMLEQLVEQEQEISYQRRILQGRIDIIRSELVRRGDASLTPEDLAQVLMDRSERRPSA